MFYSECLNKENHPKRKLKRNHPKGPEKVNIHTSKADISHRLDHYVAFVARMCTILKKLGVEDSRIEEAKDMVARKIDSECEPGRSLVDHIGWLPS